MVPVLALFDCFNVIFGLVGSADVVVAFVFVG